MYADLPDQSLKLALAAALRLASTLKQLDLRQIGGHEVNQEQATTLKMQRSAVLRTLAKVICKASVSTDELDSHFIPWNEDDIIQLKAQPNEAQ